MGSRVDLQTKLEAVLGSRNVYFQPPENLKLNYPCIIYSLGGIQPVNADDINYLLTRKYTVTLILYDPDSQLISNMLCCNNYCKLVRNFEKDGLYHYIYELFF